MTYFIKYNRLSFFLKPFAIFVSFILEILVSIRIFLYNKKVFKVKDHGVKVISVGNLNLGGTGKTPIVDFLVKTISNFSFNPAILTRGFGGNYKDKIKRIRFSENNDIDPKIFGDEPSLLAENNPNTPIYISPFRNLSAREAIQRDKVDLLLLDDAFQHISIKRDLNLLLVDAKKGFGNQKIFPLGELREPLSAIERADAILITKSGMGKAKSLKKKLELNSNITCPIFLFDYVPVSLSRLDGKEIKPPNVLKNLSVFLTCGIANPDSFLDIIQNLGPTSISKLFFNDHHSYLENSIKRMKKTAEKINFDYWIITEKDGVKLKDHSEFNNKLWVLKMRVVPDPNWTIFFKNFLDKSN